MTRAKMDCIAYKPGQHKLARRKAECTAQYVAIKYGIRSEADG